MKKLKFSLLTMMLVLLSSTMLSAFCGFYVAKAGAELFNNKSQVILVRDGKKSTITMSNDFKGNVKDFAMVDPVPTVLKKEQVKIVDQGIFSRLDAYSAPRLVEYYDQNPCRQINYNKEFALEDKAPSRILRSESVMEKDKDEYQVTIEEQFSVAEYDILVLSAKESEGLKRWLIDNNYQIPAKAEKVLKPYIKSNMKFFVVKVNLEARKKTGSPYLRPIQITFESDKFMLPIRLGMANSTGEQDMVVYAFTKTGRIEAANYRTTKVPTNRKVPVFVKQKFGHFYKDLFEKEYRKQGKNTVFLEYAWNVSPRWRGVKCDPCVGPPPIFSDLHKAGVNWIRSDATGYVFFTRLHVRYTESKFPQDLMFTVTPNKEHFQGRYILTHAANGDMPCEEGILYQEDLKVRRAVELQELAALTDWNTKKYHKYIENGTGEIDERRFEATPMSGPNNDDGNGPWHQLPYLFFFASIFGMLIAYIKSKRNKSQVQLNL